MVVVVKCPWETGRGTEVGPGTTLPQPPSPITPCPFVVDSGLGDQVHGDPQIPGIGGGILGSPAPRVPVTSMQQVKWGLPVRCLGGSCWWRLPVRSLGVPRASLALAVRECACVSPMLCLFGLSLREHPLPSL